MKVNTEAEKNQGQDELRSRSQVIEIGDPITHKDFRQVGGFVEAEVHMACGKKLIPGYMVDNGSGKLQFILKEDVVLMGGPEQKYLYLLSQSQEARQCAL